MADNRMPIKRRKDIFIVDADVHIHNPPASLAPYCDMPWRRSLEDLAESDTGYFSLPGYSPALVLDPQFPADSLTERAVLSAREMREQLNDFGIDIAVMCPNHLLFVGTFPDPSYAAALCRAYNRCLADVWLGREKGLKALIIVPPLNPEIGVREIEAYASNPHIVGVCLPTVGVDPLYGNQMYFPLYKKAQEANLPVLFHSAEAVFPVFPFNLHKFETSFARHTISHPFSLMANMISLINTGVPERFPDLRIAFLEGGISWVPFMAYRMDREYVTRRREVPFLQHPPSSYVRRFYYSTQPIEEPEPLQDLVKVLNLYGGEDNTMYSSDWPHYDFDHPSQILRLPLPEEVKRKIMGENAIRFFNLRQKGGI